MDKLWYGLQVSLIGILVVFVGLLILVACIKLMEVCFERFGKKQEEHAESVEAPASELPVTPRAQATVGAPELAGDALHATIGAVVASVWEKSTGFAIRSIRRV